MGKVGRNDLCQCGGGRKFKYCHGSVGATGLPTVTDEVPSAPLYFAEQSDGFGTLLKHSLFIGNRIGRRMAGERAVMGSWLFMRACVTAQSIERQLGSKQTRRSPRRP